MHDRIYLSPPHLTGDEWVLIREAIASNWIAPLGPNVDSFEHEICEYLNIENSVALSSGTAALHLALIIANIGAGDIVICPSLTFAASANVILYENAIPVFVDVDRSNWTIDINLLEIAIKKYSPKAVITVDIYGQSCDYEAIVSMCNKYNVILIEDAAEALGSNYNNNKCSTFGDLGILSFNGNKIITTSGGGMLVSENEDHIRKAKFLSTQAREEKIHYEHKELGYNYRMSNLLAALGRGQLKVLDDRVKSRRKVFDLYYNELSEIEGLEFMPEASNSYSNRWLTSLTINEKITGVNRDAIIKRLEKENIESRPIWKPMHLQPLYENSDYLTLDHNDFSKQLFTRGLCLPSGSNLSTNNQGKIIDIIKNLMK